MLETGRVFYSGDVHRNSICTICIGNEYFKVMKPNGEKIHLFYSPYLRNNRLFYAECILTNKEEKERVEKQLKKLGLKIKINLEDHLEHLDKTLVEKIKDRKYKKHLNWLKKKGII